MFDEAWLPVWTGLGLAWWIIAWWLTRSGPAPLSRTSPSAAARLPALELTIFKPLPPLGGNDFTYAGALESFIAELDHAGELLLGVHEADRATVAPFLAAMAQRHPAARVRPIYRTDPHDDLANPKVAWLRRLAAQAEGELWLWSDADIIAPVGFLAAARAEFTAGGTELLTFPYRVRAVARPAAWLDALFVDAEFYPGVALLRRLGLVDFALGAGMLFRRADFDRRVSWADLGSHLADDFILGQRLQPVRLANVELETQADEPDLRRALRHHLRWSKTLWWSRPYGIAAKLFILPGIGWAAAVAWHPGARYGWLGLGFTLLMDAAFALLLCARAGCRWRWRDLPWVGFWSAWRLLVWLACWIPWPVTWSGRTWWRPVAANASISTEAPG